MGNITVLRLYDIKSDTEFAIPVTNFPILPIGSLVTMKLEEFLFENLNIKGYEASNYNGNCVTVEFDSGNLSPEEPTLEQLKAITHEAKQYGYVYLYPRIIAFG